MVVNGYLQVPDEFEGSQRVKYTRYGRRDHLSEREKSQSIFRLTIAADSPGGTVRC